MGVTDLNKIVQKFPIVKFDDMDYDNVVIDCSNLITTFMMRHIPRLPHVSRVQFGQYLIRATKNELIAEDLEEQIKYVCGNIIHDLNEIINKCHSNFSNLKRIILVSDPSFEYQYKFISNDDVKMDQIHKVLFNKWIENRKYEIKDEKNINISFSSKEDERELRKKQLTYEKSFEISVEDENGEIIFQTSNYSDFWKEPEDEKYNELFNLIYHMTYLINKANCRRLISIIQNEIVKLISTIEHVKIDYYRSNTEADIFIKAYWDKNLKMDRTLVLSNDTDYNILFGECENVDTTVISPFNISNIHSPYQYWSSIFQTNNVIILRALLARLSALLGNDYTCHTRKIVCDTDPKFDLIETLIKIFNFKDVDISKCEEPKISKSTSLSKFYSLAKLNFAKISPSIYEMKKKITGRQNDKFEDIYHFLHIDKSIISDDVYFNKYYETLLIYLNYNFYDDFEIIEIDDKFEISTLIDKLTSYHIDFNILDHSVIDISHK